MEGEVTDEGKGIGEEGKDLLRRGVRRVTLEVRNFVRNSWASGKKIYVHTPGGYLRVI